ncbi:MAG: cyclic di-GMP phosphodiesterase [Thermoleophilaceae bacterium]|nr:cyclic di-GMP phosphodiesterase [Thermoleophilaceae bacterium]
MCAPAVSADSSHVQGNGRAAADNSAETRVLLVDDDEQVLYILERILRTRGYACSPTSSAEAAQELLNRGSYDLVVCDVNLPGESGIDLVARALAEDPRMAALMVSGLDDVALADRALRIGAYGYVVKPFTANDLLMRVLGALTHRQRTFDASEELRLSREETIQRLCIAVEARDNDTALHIDAMSELCGRLAHEMGLPEERAELIRTASAMHDVGKIGVADRVLQKPGPLDPEERREMEQHAEIGYRIMAGSRSELLQIAATIAWTHHEKFDGSGYPRGLAGEDIPIEGRIAAVADVFDALTRDRVYRPRFSLEEAIAIMEDGRGAHFDPRVLDVFLATLATRKPD